MAKDNNTKIVNRVVDYFLQKGESVVISHEEIMSLAEMQLPKYNDYDDQDDFMEAIKMHQFRYMTFIDGPGGLRETLLEEHKVYIKNERGVGYYILPPTEQINHGITRTKSGVYRKIKQGNQIIVNTQFAMVSFDDKKKAHDSLAAWSMAKEMLKHK
jgi:hypothetical protein